MAEKIITPIDLKMPSEENLRRIIAILKGLMAQTSQIAEQCIIEFDPETIYTNGRACFKDGNLYLAITTHQGAWDDRHFELVDGTTVEYLAKQDIADLFDAVAPEMWDYLGGIISDEISTKKTWHSSRIYEELMDVYARSVEYTIKYNARQQKASYKVVTREEEILDTQFIYLIKDGDGYQMWILTDDGPLNIGSTNIDLSAYYTINETDKKFLTQADATATYATIEQVEEIIDDANTSETNTFSSKKITNDLKEKVDVVTFVTVSDFKDFVATHKENATYIFKAPVEAAEFMSYITNGKTVASASGILCVKVGAFGEYLYDFFIYDGYLKVYTCHYVDENDGLQVNEFAPKDSPSEFELYTELESFIDPTRNNIKFFGVYNGGEDYGAPLTRMCFGRVQVQLAPNGTIRCVQTLDYSTMSEMTIIYSRTGLYSNGIWIWGEWTKYISLDDLENKKSLSTSEDEPYGFIVFRKSTRELCAVIDGVYYPIKNI